MIPPITNDAAIALHLAPSLEAAADPRKSGPVPPLPSPPCPPPLIDGMTAANFARTRAFVADGAGCSFRSNSRSLGSIGDLVSLKAHLSPYEAASQPSQTPHARCAAANTPCSEVPPMSRQPPEPGPRGCHGGRTPPCGRSPP